MLNKELNEVNGRKLVSVLDLASDFDLLDRSDSSMCWIVGKRSKSYLIVHDYGYSEEVSRKEIGVRFQRLNEVFIGKVDYYC